MLSKQAPGSLWSIRTAPKRSSRALIGLTKLQDKKFKDRVFEIMDEEIIRKFDTREGSAEDFYDVDKE